MVQGQRLRCVTSFVAVNIRFYVPWYDDWAGVDAAMRVILFAKNENEEAKTTAVPITVPVMVQTAESVYFLYWVFHPSFKQ